MSGDLAGLSQSIPGHVTHVLNGQVCGHYSHVCLLNISFQNYISISEPSLRDLVQFMHKSINEVGLLSVVAHSENLDSEGQSSSSQANLKFQFL